MDSSSSPPQCSKAKAVINTILWVFPLYWLLLLIIWKRNKTSLSNTSPLSLLTQILRHASLTKFGGGVSSSVTLLFPWYTTNHNKPWWWCGRVSLSSFTHIVMALCFLAPGTNLFPWILQSHFPFLLFVSQDPLERHKVPRDGGNSVSKSWH